MNRRGKWFGMLVVRYFNIKTFKVLYCCQKTTRSVDCVEADNSTLQFETLAATIRTNNTHIQLVPKPPPQLLKKKIEIYNYELWSMFK